MRRLAIGLAALLAACGAQPDAEAQEANASCETGQRCVEASGSVGAEGKPPETVLQMTRSKTVDNPRSLLRQIPGESRKSRNAKDDPWIIAVESLENDLPVTVRATGIEAVNRHFADDGVQVGPPTCFGYAVPNGTVVCRITRWSPYTYRGQTRSSEGTFGQTVILPITADAAGEQVFTYRSHFHGGPLSPPITVEFDVVPGTPGTDPRLDYVLAEARDFFNPDTANIACNGIPKQGGLVVCQTAPNAAVEIGRSETDTYTQQADANGILLVGFDRDEPSAFVMTKGGRIDFDIAPRDYDTSRINGLPKNMVSEYTEDELKRIRAATARKKVGFASKAEEIGFRDGFIFPIQSDFIKTTNFGAQRILNGEPKRPHFGVDLAAPKGTPIVAPADGIVSLADEDMYFEGSLVMIDHGQGLISYYLHNEDVLVEAGQRVKQGEQIATVGSRGRSTGPHLCWRLKWRGRNLDPELLATEWPKDG